MGILEIGIAVVVLLLFAKTISLELFFCLRQFYKWIFHRKYFWVQKIPHEKRLQFISTSLAVRPTVLGHATPLGYRLACLYFGGGLIDRTQTLDHGFPYTVLDPIPSYNNDIETLKPDSRIEAEDELSKLCRQRAQKILNRARVENRTIRILWSGGIDSTAAACSLIQNSDPKVDKLEFYYGENAVIEYKSFFKNIVRQYPHIKIKCVTESLDAQSLLVTGEHGDQLFGSTKTLNLQWADLNAPWQPAFAKQLKLVLASDYRVEQVINYLSPQIAMCPIPVVSLFDVLWWINFSLRWQSVSLRIPLSIARSNNGDLIQQQLLRTEHFFRDSTFEIWALRNRRWAVNPTDWKSYKKPLKKVIFDFNHDEHYFNNKLKILSLPYVSPSRGIHSGLAWDGDKTMLYQPFDNSLKKPILGKELKSTGFIGPSKQIQLAGTISLEATYVRSNESDLWGSINNDSEAATFQNDRGSVTA